jgi:Cdc6-like AAA superfamily ATPase
MSGWLVDIHDSGTDSFMDPSLKTSIASCLTLSHGGNAMSGRHAELKKISEFIKSSLKSTGKDSSNILLLKGMPGTGKTRSVLTITTQLNTRGSKFEFHTINAMKLAQPADLYMYDILNCI